MSGSANILVIKKNIHCESVVLFRFMSYIISIDLSIYYMFSSSHSIILPSSQDWLCSLACKIKAIQIESKQDLLPPLSVGSQLENTVSHPGQGRARARSIKNRNNNKKTAHNSEDCLH